MKLESQEPKLHNYNPLETKSAIKSFYKMLEITYIDDKLISEFN